MLDLFDEAGKKLLRPSAAETGSALVLLDDAGKTRAKIRRSAASVVTFDKDENIIWRAS